ncbi:UDP-N-acetylmuramate: L-alanyl-gamma-D-glutamyl-meso-diaminopimelate ligase [Catalinimonas alkaloidigena]|uniref:UDP-N-acetylmuramate--L-alanine ligase n=1 Tax=Catalinimonas alkaloidigena TaxID=1075417 RepID=UPI002406648A|nr:Mur ligase family protein [Catalinimonas alkaloidigena]MDF9795835.1 UDP-N-acetylmuramate: L-alanyl-gamma-D-glutamyl-meso-diaminopimelate ligase [Catalinimonas alkaloidigena]
MQNNISRVHFIAIGGSVMHDLALHLAKKGVKVSGSDDEIYDPAKSALKAQGLLPEQFGWFPEKITDEIDAIVLGMHARPDNPELKRAQELGLKVYSYPEYIYEQSKDKQRIVIAGSHGKTTITSMILHVLQYLDREFDYVIGAKTATVEGLVKLSDAPVIVIEGDEYLTSPIDPSPKCLKYQHHIGLISGIAWDHYNVFPTLDDYVKQFELFADASPKGGSLIYCEEDDLATMIGGKERADVNRIEYRAHPHLVKDGVTYLKTEEGDVKIQLFGYHNMQNISGAMEVCLRIGVLKKDFYQAMPSFGGASKRLELVASNAHTSVFKDFAHAPSKLLASSKAVKQQYPGRTLVACMELHTFSSLNKEFITQYQDTLNDADIGVVYHNPEVSRHKKLEPLTDGLIKEAFNRNDLKIFTDSQSLKNFLEEQEWTNKNLLLMSSGNYGGIDLDAFGKSIVASN